MAASHPILPFDELTYFPTPRWIRGTRRGSTVVDSRQAILVWEPGKMVPIYAFPAEDVAISVDGDAVAVIDFDDCGFCWYLYDLGATLTLYEDAPNVDELVASWVDGYRAVAPLCAEDEREIPTFLMLRRLMVSAYVGLRSDTELADKLRRTGYNSASCKLAEKYLSRFG
jgi:hypothetical protein